MTLQAQADLSEDPHLLRRAGAAADPNVITDQMIRDAVAAIIASEFPSPEEEPIE